MSEVPQFESAESASPIITRLIAGVLQGRHEQVFNFPPLERLGMQLLNHLPLSFAQWIVRGQFSRSSLTPGYARRLTAESLAEQRLMDYQPLEEKYPVIVVGAALAGAAAHIAAVLKAPFLPQPFILGLRGGSPDESLSAHLAVTTPVAEEILERNPILTAISHFDPVHDGWLTRTVSHLRLKLIGLPLAYESFLRNHLEPGGTILYLNCTARWMQFPVRERLSCQIGGWGGIPSEEYLSGSERIDQFLASKASPHRGGWWIPGIKPAWAPESEWGSVPGLDRALEDFASEHGFRFQPLILKHPHDFSRLALAAHQRLFEQVGRSPAGILVEMFTQYDPYTALNPGLLPLWLVFNTSDSLDFLMQMLEELPSELPIFFSGLTTLSRTPDMVPWEGWRKAFARREWLSVGADPQRYPEDLVALFRWNERLLRHLPEAITGSLPKLALPDFLSLLSN